MTEWVVTSSLLILGVVILRALLRSRISRGLQYAIWLLVLARLLCPFSLFESRLSPMNTVERLAPQTEAVYALPSEAVPVVPSEPAPAASVPEPVSSGPDAPAPREILTAIWFGGSILCSLWFLAVNLRFGARLRRSRRLWKKGKLPVYVTEAVVSPCLFGLLRPAVYLTPRAVEPDVCTDHVILHEVCHFRHGDHIWSVLRCLCLAVHWWNPLVWLAAFLSRQDGELCCDESAIRRCGDRLAYGRTLVDMVARQPSRASLLCTATAMAASRRSLRERVRSIARQPRVWLPAVIVVLLAAALLAFCLFSGAVSGTRLHGDLLDSYACVSGGVEYAMPDELGEELAALLQGSDYGPLTPYDDTPEYAADWQFLCRSGDTEYRIAQDTGGWRIIRSAPDGTTSALLPDSLTESIDFSIWWKQCDSEVSAQIAAAREPDPLDAKTDGTVTMHFNAGYEDFPNQKETVRSLNGHAEAALREVFEKTFPTAADAVFDPDLGFTVGGVTYEIDTVHARMETGGVRYDLHYDDVNTILLTACGCLYGSETSIRPLFSRLSQLSPATETGEALFLDYADETILIFHGEFGFFVYDREQEAITVARDLVDLMGWNTVTGEPSVQVRISTDGSTVMLFSQGQTGPSEGALYLDPHTGQTWSDFYGLFTDFLVSETEHPAVFLLENGSTGRLSSADGTVGGLLYEENGVAISLFDRYFADAAPASAPWQMPALNPDSDLEPLTVPEGTAAFPAGSLWEYTTAETTLEELRVRAETAAALFWDAYTEETGVDSVRYLAPVEDSAYGDVQESIFISCSSGRQTLDYQRHWLQNEEAPFRYGPQTIWESDVLVARARAFLSGFGLDGMTEAEPSIRETLVSPDGDPDFTEVSQTVEITWPCLIDGLPVSYYSLTVRLINGEVAALHLSQPALERTVPVNAPALLTAEEATDCLNYTRSFAPEDSLFRTYTLLADMRPTLCRVSDRWVPAWAFTLWTEARNPGHICTVWVDAQTGATYTGTNEGDYPAPG